MNDNLKAARINFQAACLNAEIARMQAGNRQFPDNEPFHHDCFDRCLIGHGTAVESILQEKSDEGPFRFGVDPPPKDGTHQILWWNPMGVWDIYGASSLRNGDIWRYQPPEPTELLG